jgi:4-hydroxy-tetrahydrodipicolinate reductase
VAAHGWPSFVVRNTLDALIADAGLTPGEVHTARLATCTQVINRIPDVINAAPGFVTVTQLPRLRYRHFSLDRYVDRR